jgi:predicted ester cyclase
MSKSGTTAKDVAQEFYESYNRKDLDASWESYISAALVNHAMGGGHDGESWRETDKGFFVGFSDLTLTILDQLAEGDKVATRYVMGGTHDGEFFGIPATGRTASLTCTSVDRVHDGKIAEHWADLDFTGFIQRLAEECPSPAIGAAEGTGD